MTTPTFTPPKAPDRGLTKKSQTKTLEADFGDGYSQRANDGLNNIRRNLPLTWTLLTPEEADEIESFLEARKGSEAFFYTAPRDTTPKKWRCKTWDRTMNGVDDTITATFEQVFDL